ncbi:competence type IV pilus minor pilin ComGF [Bacillus xiapuensis]|uniref:competence type IV pilus minor pilin ComGF n=1 Tax=Bacillus xiapuensis TaxID=2014075 RepID=UPI0012FE2A1B|nr:competence type IV pilus minor pilin ComGF [Bacillus xiapuensis]
MVEALLVLMVFISVAALFPMLYGAVGRVDEQLQPGRKAEWELFVLELRKELSRSHSWLPDEDKLSFMDNGRLISIEKYGEGVRRRVNGKGHEMVLLEIQAIRFYWDDSTMCVAALFHNGEREEAQIHLFSAQPQ